MSLLEDIFLQDEANEAQELERVIEGDEFEDRPRSDSDNNSEREDEAEEDKRKVEPTTTKAKRIIKNPRFVLNPARLTGPRGIQVIPGHFKDFKFKGKGHEKEDLDLILKKMEHWAYRLYPKFKFEDCLKKIETLGKKRPVMVHLHKIRSDQFVSEETVVQKDSSDEETPVVQPEEDEFDRLLQQQIELARSTPAPNSVKKQPPLIHSPLENRSLNIPKATSSPSISEEQKERMLRNRRLAEERRLARLTNTTKESNETTQIINMNTMDNKDREMDKSEIGTIRRHNRSNVIDSSEEEDNSVSYVNESIAVDIHSNSKGISSLSSKENDIDTFQPVNEITKLINGTDDILEMECTNLNKSNKVSDSDYITINDNVEKNYDVLKKSDLTKDIQYEVIMETDIHKGKEEFISKEKNNLEKENLDKTQSDKVEKEKTDIQMADVNLESIEKDQELAQVEQIMDVDFNEEF